VISIFFVVLADKQILTIERCLITLKQRESEKKQYRIIYSSYLSIKTSYENGLSSLKPRIVSGTGSSLESSALENIITGEIRLTPSEQAAIISENSRRYGSISFVPNAFLQSDLLTDFSMGTGDFTAECWAKADQTIGGGWTNLITFGSAAGQDIRIAAGGDFFAPNGGNIGIIIPNNSGSEDLRYRINYKMTSGNWYHLALVRYGSFVKFYLNGISRVLVNDGNGQSSTNGVSVDFNHSGDVNGKSSFFVNNSLFNESSFSGLISNIRLVKGAAVYRDNFTVPNLPIGLVIGTVVLMNTESSSTYLKDSSPYNHTFTRTGSVSFVLTSPFS